MTASQFPTARAPRPRRPGPARLLLLSALLAAGCRAHPDPGPIMVSVIGPQIGATPIAPDRRPLAAPDATLLTAAGQGLVRFDAAGQIVPGLAARWIVTDGGRSLIFRLPDLPRPGAAPIDAEAVARRLRAAIAAGSDNRLKPLLGAIDEIDAVTPQVIDIELKAPRPNLLMLFAQPELAMGGTRRGPFRIAARQGAAVRLDPLPDPDADPDSPSPLPPAVWLRGEAAGTAIARFLAGRSDLLIGGRIDDLPIVRLANPPRGTLHADPTPGLFGFAATAMATGAAASPDGRRALAMAIDRDRIGQWIALPGWMPTTRLLPAGTPEVPQPTSPAWASLSLAARRTSAAAIIGQIADPRPLPPLRVAMPGGPGDRMLFARIAADWRAIGVQAVRVAPDAPADLRLIDEVAPADIASFYLRHFACDRGVPCTDVSDRMLVAARYAGSLAERAVLLQQADALIADTAPFIPIGTPVRWSLVAPSLDLYRDSPRARHPLNELRSPSKR